MRYTYALEMDAPIEKVFDLIHDPERHKLWLQGVEETRYVGAYDPANPVGAKFKQKIREGRRVQEYDGEVTAFARPTHLGIRLFTPQFSVQVDYRLTSLGGGTHLDYSAELSICSWFFRVIAAVFSWFMKGTLRKQMNKLKELAENETAAESASLARKAPKEAMP
jgi:carbon monoxide dehydrogenase subunit G